MKRTFSRRAVLRGTGVALALPFMESLAPRIARAQTADLPKRFIPIYFPNGVSKFWRPVGTGLGDAWQLSAILEPLAAFKSKMTVLTNIENYSSLANNLDTEPSHARLPGAFLTCVDSDEIRASMGNPAFANGISVDQVIAQKLAGTTPLDSLQVGLSTIESYCDGRHCSLSQSVSWRDEQTPLYKEVNPITLFDMLVANGASETDGETGPDPAAQAEAEKRRALDKSVLDAVLESATGTQSRLGYEDRLKMDQFLTSVREIEGRVMNVGGAFGGGNNLACSPISSPAAPASYGLANGTNGYDKASHASVMNDLIVMALQCDVSRIITYMLDDSRSEFVYNHLTQRAFTATTSTEGSGTCAEFHGLQHAGNTNNGFATINWWLSSVVADLCSKMDAVPEGEGTLLDNSILMYASAMEGGNHDGNDLPIALLGGGGGLLKQDQHVMFAETPGDRPLRDLYFTIMNAYFGLGETDFGINKKGQGIAMIEEILA